MSTRWQLGDNGDGRQWWTITTESGEIVAQAVSRQDAEAIVERHNASQASQPNPNVRAAAERLVADAERWTFGNHEIRVDIVTVARAVLEGQGGEGEVARYRRALERAGTDLIGFEGYFERQGSHGTVASIRETLRQIDAALAGQGGGGEVDRYRRALETIKRQYGRVCAEFELCHHPACESSVGAWMEANAALAGQGGGGEVERLRQINALARALMEAHHLHERDSDAFWQAYYRLSNALVGNPWLSPGEPNPLAAPATAPRDDEDDPGLLTHRSSVKE